MQQGLSEPGHSGNNCSILLVEDNKINQKVVILMLARYGITPVTADSGREALEAVREQRFDLILMDLHMPGMDGVETTREIRAVLGAACPPVIALTADVVKGSDKEAIANGLDGYLAKPISSDILRGCINTYTDFRV